LSIALKGRKLPVSVIEKISQKLKNRRLSESHKRAIGLSRKGKKLSQDVKEKIKKSWVKRRTLGLYRKKMSSEMKLRISLGKLKRKKESLSIVLLGGAFDPPTPGHIEVAELLLHSGFDIVLLVPCYKHAFGKKMGRENHRLAMLKLAIRNNSRIKIFEYEILNKLNGDTYTFIKKLLSDKKYKDFQFSLAIGMDNANSFNKWVNYQDLERMIRIVVIPRTGIQTFKNAWYLKPPHMLLIPEKPLLRISSTNIRNSLRAQTPNKGHFLSNPKFIDPEVLKYIKTHKLYK
jgi:nicotinate-nucleotide adenylyltransferase